LNATVLLMHISASSKQIAAANVRFMKTFMLLIAPFRPARRTATRVSRLWSAAGQASIEAEWAGKAAAAVLGALSVSASAISARRYAGPGCSSRDAPERVEIRRVSGSLRRMCSRVAGSSSTWST
jgi:hypothetical protein